jgi:hypothetical protein
LASTLDGAKRIAQATDPLPADWLCTFDPVVRFAKPGRAGTLMEPGPHFVPFAAYGLDSDPVPANFDPENSIFEIVERLERKIRSQQETIEKSRRVITTREIKRGESLKAERKSDRARLDKTTSKLIIALLLSHAAQPAERCPGAHATEERYE